MTAVDRERDSRMLAETRTDAQMVEMSPLVAALGGKVATARTALAEIARISGGPIRRIALDALDKMEKN